MSALGELLFGAKAEPVLESRPVLSAQATVSA